MFSGNLREGFAITVSCGMTADIVVGRKTKECHQSEGDVCLGRRRVEVGLHAYAIVNLWVDSQFVRYHREVKDLQSELV
jgi:hypothetical protein